LCSPRDDATVVDVARGTLTQRVEVLEHQAGNLATLPERVTTIETRLGNVERGLVEFRTEVHSEFAGVRAEIAAVRTEGRQGDDAIRAELQASVVTLRKEIRDGDDETRRYMRVLYEDLVGRLQVMGEGIEELRRR
jgi:hypothetical protein